MKIFNKESKNSFCPHRRTIIKTSILSPIVFGSASANAQEEGAELIRDWGFFKARFMQPDGRIIDTHTGFSHSEGQSYAMIIAEACNDRAAFEQALNWARTVLKRPDDHLLSWQYRPFQQSPNNSHNHQHHSGTHGHGHVFIPDRNNATDADIMMAWALFRAAERWSHDPYRQLALHIVRDLKRFVFVNTLDGPVLMPGMWGFRHMERFVLNPSYYIFPALARFEREMPGAGWRQLAERGLYLIDKSRTGPFQLVPDWIEVNRHGRSPRPSSSNPARFGYDAVRVPLNLIWGGYYEAPALQDILSFWRYPPGRLTQPDGQPPRRGAAQDLPPAWINLYTPNITSPERMPPGFQSISSLGAFVISGQRMRPRFYALVAGEAYYSAALTLLARVAYADILAGRVPTRRT